MKRFLTGILAIVVMLTSACAHKEPTLADQLAAEDLGRTETVSAAPVQESVPTESLGEAGMPAEMGPAVAPVVSAPTQESAPVVKSFKKKAKKRFAKGKSKKRGKKLLAKGKKRRKSRTSSLR